MKGRGSQGQHLVRTFWHDTPVIPQWAKTCTACRSRTFCPGAKLLRASGGVWGWINSPMKGRWALLMSRPFLHGKLLWGSLGIAPQETLFHIGDSLKPYIWRQSNFVGSSIPEEVSPLDIVRQLLNLQFPFTGRNLFLVLLQDNFMCLVITHCNCYGLNVCAPHEFIRWSPNPKGRVLGGGISRKS